MQIGDDQAVLMEMLVRAMGATRAVEIGTFTGYSALAVLVQRQAETPGTIGSVIRNGPWDSCYP